MTTNNVLYFNDGHDVSVTGSCLQVKNRIYPLDGIYSHKIEVVPPHRVFSMVLMGMGILIFICGAMNFLPAPINGSISILGVNVIANAIVMALGIVVLATAMFVMFHLHERYQVKVATAYGEKTVLESDKREYVNQIIDALNHACLDVMKTPRLKRQSL